VTTLTYIRCTSVTYSGHHDSVRLPQDLLEVLQGLDGLDLRDDARGRAVGGQLLQQQGHVVADLRYVTGL
jgi:hypothetical protein